MYSTLGFLLVNVVLVAYDLNRFDDNIKVRNQGEEHAFPECNN